MIDALLHPSKSTWYTAHVNVWQRQDMFILYLWHGVLCNIKHALSLRFLVLACMMYSIKPTEHGLGIKRGKIKSIPKTLNNCVIKHKLYVPCASFAENRAQTRIFSNTPFNIRGYHFLVHGTEKGITSFCMHFTCLSMQCNIFKSQRFNIIFLDWDSGLNYIFRLVCFDPKLCALVPINICFIPRVL